MTIYIDIVLLINFIIDLLLLMTVSYVLKRKVSSNRLILGALTGTFSILSLFLKMNNIVLFIYKILLAVIICIVSFKYENIKYTLKNIMYFYVVSFLLGGFLYFINNQLSYKNTGLSFYKEKSGSLLFIIFLSPIILYLYYKQSKELKNNFNNYYNVNIYLKDNIINVNGYLDTGNKLVDPYLKKPVIILNKRKMIYDINEFKMILVPYQTVSEINLLKCIIVDKVEVVGLGYIKNALVGLIDDKININGVDLILNTKLLEDLNV